MPSNKPKFTFRTDTKILEILHQIAEQEGRSDNKQLEYILKKFINEYESKNGKINLMTSETKQN